MAETSSKATAPNVQNGTYTVDHPERGHYTLKLHTAQKGGLAGKRIISLLTGPDNENNYSGVAFWNDENREASVWKRFMGREWVRLDGKHWAVGSDANGFALDAPGMSSTQKKIAIWVDLVNRGYAYTESGIEALPTWETCDEHEFRKGQLFVNGARHGNSFWIGEGYTLLLEGRCLFCNRRLTDPESIRLGSGPKCGGRA